MKTWIVSSPIKLLTFLKEKVQKDIKTTDIRWSVEHNRCMVNGNVERFCSKTLNRGDRINLYLSQKPSFCFKKELILYEDEWMLAYNKPPYISSMELASLLNLKLVHRLDRDTTGVLLLAKNEEGKKALENLFRKRELHKEYLAIVTPPPQKKEGVINLPMRPLKKREGAVLWGIGKGFFAKTNWKLLQKNLSYALLSCSPHTGRTHQVRVHLKAIGHPILGDFEYGPKDQKKFFRPLLHAYKLKFTHPFRNNEIVISAFLPLDFEEALNALFHVKGISSLN